MGVFEYVSVLTSIIIGLGIAHLLQGVATLVQYADRDRPYWVHLVWVVVMFFQASFFWWWEFALESLEHWTFEIYLFLLLYSVIIYLLCALLFPRDFEGYSGFEDYFMARRAWFLGLLVSFYLVDFVDTALREVNISPALAGNTRYRRRQPWLAAWSGYAPRTVVSTRASPFSCSRTNCGGRFGTTSSPVRLQVVAVLEGFAAGRSALWVRQQNP